ncbi:hypothetical protein FF1_039782 [Malus domestica]
MTACILDPSRELGGHHNAQTIGVQITPDATDIKGAGRLYKDEKAVKQWIFSSFTNVKKDFTYFRNSQPKTCRVPMVSAYIWDSTEKLRQAPPNILTRRKCGC